MGAIGPSSHSRRATPLTQNASLGASGLWAHSTMMFHRLPIAHTNERCLGQSGTFRTLTESNAWRGESGKQEAAKITQAPLIWETEVICST